MIKIKNPFKQPLQAIAQIGSIATLPLTVGPAIAADWLSGNRTATGNLIAAGTEGRTKNELDKINNDAEANAENDARSGLLNDALNDRSLDSQTLRELQNLYQSGSSSTDIAAILNNARQGKGIYGVRAINANQAAFMKAMPGRKQILSLGKGNILGV